MVSSATKIRNGKALKGLYLSSETIEQISAYADTKKASRSTVVEQAIAEYLSPDIVQSILPRHEYSASTQYSLDPAIANQLAEYSDQTGINQSRIVEAACDCFLRKYAA